MATSAASQPRRRIRRVADEDRKRSKLACNRCKSRKNKCIPTSSGICERCRAGSHLCKFESSSIYDQPSIPRSNSTSSGVVRPEETSSPSAHHAAFPSTVLMTPADRPSRQSFMFRLRESFFLDPVKALDERDLARNETSIPPHSITPEQRHRAQHAAKSFPPRDIARFLVEKCISHGTDSFFYFDQAVMLQRVDDFYNPASNQRDDVAFVCLALATFALGSQWTSLDHRSTPANRNEQDPGLRFYLQARLLIPDLLDRPSLTSIQAAYLLGVYRIPTSAPGAGYVYIGLALRQAVSLGYHLEESQPMRPYEREIQRRLFWSVYALDRTYSSKLGRPRSLDIDYISLRLPQADSTLLPGQRYDNLQHQIANAKLAMLLDRVADFGTYSADKASLFQRLDRDLKAWKRDLPPDLQFENLTVESPYYRTVFHLHLNSLIAWITMGKLSILSVVRTRLTEGTRAQGQSADLSAESNMVSQAAIKAAQKILRLFEKVKISGQLARFSYTDFQGCSVATVIILLSGILYRDFEYAAHVDFGLSCLKQLAGPHVNVNIGVQFVESLKTVADECYMRIYHGTEAAKRPTNPEDGNLRRWSDWVASVEANPPPAASPWADPDSAGPPLSPTSFVHEQTAIPEVQHGTMPVELPTPHQSSVDPNLDDTMQTAMSDSLMQPVLWADHNYDMTFNMMNYDEDFLVTLTGMDGLNDIF